MIYKSDTVGYR